MAKDPKKVKKALEALKKMKAKMSKGVTEGSKVGGKFKDVAEELDEMENEEDAKPK